MHRAGARQSNEILVQSLVCLQRSSHNFAVIRASRARRTPSQFETVTMDALSEGGVEEEDEDGETRFPPPGVSYRTENFNSQTSSSLSPRDENEDDDEDSLKVISCCYIHPRRRAACSIRTPPDSRIASPPHFVSPPFSRNANVFVLG